MSKRNFILLIIILAIAVVAVFGFLFFWKSGTNPDGTGTNFGNIFNPFPSGKPTTPTPTPPVDVSGYVPPPEPIAEHIKLKKVSSMPVAGFTVYQKERLLPPVATQEVNPPAEITPPAPTTSTKKTTIKIVKPTPPPTEFMPALRYVARATGNIYQTFADKLDEKKFSKTIIPKVYEALFGNKGESVVMRYLKTDNRTIETFVGNIPKELLDAPVTGDNEVKGSFLPENIQDISLSSDASSVFYLFNTGKNMIGTTLNLATNKKAQIFDSAFTEWLSFWPNSKMITLNTKPSYGVPGYMYTIDPNTNNNLTKVLGDINGLTTVASPNGKLIFYADNNLSLGIYHTDTKIVDSLALKTLPEKCVWGKANDTAYCAVPKSSNAGQYPDSWYQGEVSFSDQIWKIDLNTGNTTLLVDPITVKGGEDTDAIKLGLDENENYLFFVNKKDSFLWELELK